MGQWHLGHMQHACTVHGCTTVTCVRHPSVGHILATRTVAVQTSCQQHNHQQQPVTRSTVHTSPAGQQPPKRQALAAMQPVTPLWPNRASQPYMSRPCNCGCLWPQGQTQRLGATWDMLHARTAHTATFPHHRTRLNTQHNPEAVLQQQCCQCVEVGS